MGFITKGDPLKEVRYSVVIRFHEDDLERLKELVAALPDHHEVVIPNDQDFEDEEADLVRATWSFNTKERHYGAPKRLLREAGFKVVGLRRQVGSGVFSVAPRGRVTRVEDWQPIPPEPSAP
jgi:hypothetical protein